MATFRKSAIAVGVTLSAMFASNAFAIGSEAECEEQVGNVYKISGDVLCVMPMRRGEAAKEIYDDAKLGVKDCTGGAVTPDGNYCTFIVYKAPRIKPDDLEVGKGLKAGDIVNEKGEKVMDAAASATDAKEAVKEAAEK